VCGNYSKEIVCYYEENNADIVGILERPFLEGAVTARFLTMSDRSVVEDYRCAPTRIGCGFSAISRMGHHFFIPSRANAF
jgi:hypothetical protein